MIPRFRLWLVIILITCGTAYSQDSLDHASLPAGKTRLIILNPTIGNLENFMRLIEFHAISIPNLELVGVYHPKQHYDFKKSLDYLKNHPDLPIRLYPIKNNLDPDSLFCPNACTQEFYTLFKTSHGTLALGGPDIPPAVYQAETHLTTAIVDPWRHYFETSYLFHLLGGNRNPEFKPFLESNPTYVVMGFCLGMQTMNVAAGGTLIQDIPSQIYQIMTLDSVFRLPDDRIHKNYWFNLPVNLESMMSYHLHSIAWISSPSWLKSPIQPLVCSAHHQCVDQLGQGFSLIATSLDGKIPEIMIHQSYPKVIGVQFHPEYSDIYDPEFRFRRHPGDSLQSLLPLLNANGTIEFYRRLWAYYLDFN